MKLYFLFLIFVIGSMNIVMAVGFSPSSLTFKLEPNQEGCKMITIDSESEIMTVSNSWAENKNVEWKVSLFGTEADSHGISIDYPSELSLDERNVEVCLSGSDIGEYHGVLLIKEEQQGNSIIQMGVWLKVVISEKQENQQEASSSSSSSSSSGGGGGSPVIKNSTNNTTKEIAGLSTGINEENQENYTSDEETKESYISRITGGVIGTNKTAGDFIIRGLILIVLVAAALMVYRNYNRRKNWGN